MATVKTRIRVLPDGSLTGRAAGLPAGEHEAEVTLTENGDGPVSAHAETLLARVRTIQLAFARLPVLDRRSPDQIIDYNERGHFD